MKLKTLNENPALFYDIRALVEKICEFHDKMSPEAIYKQEGFGPRGIEDPIFDTYKVLVPHKLIIQARAILERWKKLEEE